MRWPRSACRATRPGRLAGMDSRRSGQAMLEACIGLAVMVLFMVLVGYTTWMGQCKIRTAMAARHAAWMLGNTGDDPSDDEVAGNLAEWFFSADDSGLVEVATTRPKGSAAALVSDTEYGYGDQSNREGAWVQVTFGIKTNDLAMTDKYPFVLVRNQVPFMPEMRMQHFLSVASQCQWEEVAETWTDPLKAIEGVFDVLIQELKDALGAVGSVLSAILDVITSAFG